jgi:hypothetical protein
VMIVENQTVTRTNSVDLPARSAVSYSTTQLDGATCMVSLQTGPDALRALHASCVSRPSSASRFQIRQSPGKVFPLVSISARFLFPAKAALAGARDILHVWHPVC